MELGLKGKVAIVTGGTEGIGRAAAFMFAREGAKIAICGRKTETVSKVVSDIEAAGGDAYGMATDIRKSEDIDRFMTAVLDNSAASTSWSTTPAHRSAATSWKSTTQHGPRILI